MHPPFSCICHTCQWGYSPDSWPYEMICSWACLTSSSAATREQNLLTPTINQVQRQHSPVAFIWHSSNASSPCPHFVCPNNVGVQDRASCWTLSMPPCSHIW
jgi:hypothetical protein